MAKITAEKGALAEGTCTLLDGDSYEGDFADGKITGKGKYDSRKNGRRDRFRV